MPKKASALVVGVSGGIDSAVVSTISSMTGLKTFVLSMPIKQIKTQDDLSKLHCKWLVSNFKSVSYLNVDLDNVFSSFENALGENNSEHAFANSRARLRMTTLYQVAGSNNGIVVGTGNKVEDFGVGFYTKYGDGGVDISPIADCTKSQV
jgi:NAD+ synthase